eukprot:TRINITY_DN29802_c0_g1_i1.p3 TRINITY_DN29802_c0_g1~~TRINITY_DN29802_c0_g1_i1.p3  ORF type:complete len:216 (+),score=109.66 TRINITY_DN29802_c0_g1_i1:64-711(+)
MSASDRLVKLMKTTDGRDKMYKFAAGFGKLASYNAVDASAAKKADAVVKSITDARSLMRMLKWIQKGTEVQKENKAIQSGKSSNVTRSYVKVMRLLGDMGYIIGDNLQWLGKYGMLPLDSKTTQARAKVFQFWGYICALYLHVYDMLIHMGKAATLSDKAGKKLVLTFIRDLCDTLIVLSAVGYVPSWKPSKGLNGALTLVSATISCSANWDSTA